MTKGLLLLHLICLGTAVKVHADEPEWQVISSGKVKVKSRNMPNGHAKEIWAEGELQATVRDLQSTLMEHEHFPKFMPYVKEARTVGQPSQDGGNHVYSRLEFPVIASRDFVLRVHLIESVREDGSGNFRNQWKAVSDYLPERANIVRLKVNEGSWYVTPLGDGTKSWVVYRFVSDTGGWVPGFIADMINKTGVSDTYAAVEKEAQRRQQERMTASRR